MARQPSLEKALGAMASRHPACARPAAMMPKGKASSANEAAEAEPKEKISRLSTKPAATKVETKPKIKKVAGKDKSADKKKKTKNPANEREKENKGKTGRSG